MSNWTIKENSQGELQVTVEGDAWQDAQVKAFDKLAKNVEVKGFRKGQAPKNLVQKQLSSQQVMMEAIDLVAQEALSAGVEEHKLWVVARPELKIEDFNESKAELVFVVTVKPEVKLGAYKNLPYEVKEQKVTEKEVTAELEKLQQQYAELEVKEDGTIETGNTAIIDFEGFNEGVAFEGGKAENHSLEIGSNSFIPGFEDQLIGMKTNDEKEINVTFPEDYQAEDLKGKPVVFKVKINEIKVNKIPALDDDLVKDVNIEGVTTIAELKAHYKKNMQEAKKSEAESEATNALLDTVVESASVDIPEVMIADETDEMLKDYGTRLQQQGFSLEQFMKLTGQTAEQMKEQFKDDAVKRVKLRLVLEAISIEEKIEVAEELVNQEYEKIAEQYSMEIDKVKEIIPSVNLEYDIKLQKALDVVKGK